jgi:FHS family Na+ dependent glucose MFS transporter 1
VKVAADDRRLHERAPRSPVAAYLGSFVFLGMALSIGGPALPYLRERTGSGIGASGFVLAGQSFGYILGSLAAGRPYDRGAGHRLLVGSALVSAIAIAALSTVSELWMVVGVFSIIGFSASAIDVGGNTLSVWSQPADRVGSTLNALHLCFGVGALSTPLLVSAALGLNDDLSLIALCLVVGVVMIALALRGTQQPVRREAVHHHEVDSSRANPAFLLLCLFFFLYVGAEVTFAGWVTTYGDEIHIGGKDAAAVLTSVFWAGFVTGRVVAVGLTRRVSLATMLIGACALSTAAAFVLAVGDNVNAVVWVVTGLIGFFLGPQYATMLAFGDQRMRLSGSSTSLIVASSGVGGLTLPIATGWVLDRGGASLLPWAVGCACLLTTAVTVATVVVGGHRPPVTSTNAPVT